jgi:hypothetical protein
MSWETTQWANRQRMKDAQTQCLVLVLANAADPSGLAFGWRKGGDHWGQYMVDHTRLSRASVYRKIKELRDIGLADPQVIIHEDGTKQYVVQLDLEAFAEWHDESAEGVSDGHYVVQRTTPRTGEAGRSPAEKSAALDGMAMAADSESQAETHECVRGVFRHPGESHGETKFDGVAVSLAPAESHAETNLPNVNLTGETARDSLKQESPKKDSPPTPSRPNADTAKVHPMGFGVLRRDYPQADVIPLRVWERAADEFAKLSEVDRDRAANAAARYRAVIIQFTRKPINPDKWIRDREFERYGPGASLSTATPRIFRAAGTEAWQAWCNVFGVLYGNPQQPPRTNQAKGPRGEPGIIVPAEWPLGGEGWIVPLEEWVFVEQRTPNFNRYNERLIEIFGRSIMTIRASSPCVKPHHKHIGRGPDGALSDPAAMGALVPREWPPPKGDQTERIEVSDSLRKQLAG